MKTRFFCFSMFLVFLLNTFYSFAQQEIVVSDSAVDGSIKFALVQKLSKTAQAEDPKTLLKRVLKAGPGNKFYLYKVVNDKLGMTHEKYQQTFNGIKVEFREFIVHKDKSGNIVSINGDYAKISESFNIIPKLEFNEALTTAGLTKDIGNYQILKLPIAKSFETPISKRGDNYELVIVKGYDNQYHLAYKANIAGPSIFDSFYGYSDCETGELVFKQKLIYHSNTTGTAATIYAGSRTITTDSYPGGYWLRETLRGGTNTPIETYNFNRAPAYYVTDVDNGIANATGFSDNDNNWTVAEHNTNFDRAALDAHWGAEMTFDYFKTLHSRNSHDGNNGLIKSFIHVRTRNEDGNPIDMDNAFWLESRMAMFYGDGLDFDPTVSLDICAHELGHAVCNGSIGANREGLIYSKESGALNESLSDIWGACVEQWATSGKQTWLMGEDVFYIGLRSMSNPNDFYHPDTYQGTNWVNTECGTPSDANDNCGVHTNSGVGNYWFYLLSQGGTGTNDIGNAFNVSGIGITDAAKIVYRMEDVYLNSTNGLMSHV
jgi:bacillolysin